MKPELSIIIVNYNTAKLVIDCIASIEKSKPKTSYEVIVVDNGSKDANTFSFPPKNFRLIANSQNLGFAKANNQGIKDAKGEYVLLLNSDTLVKKGSIDKLIEFAKRTPKVGVVGSKLLNKDGSLQPSCFRFPTIANAISEYWLGKKGLSEKYAPKGKKAVRVDAVVGASFLITPAALSKVGILDERYFMYFEDVDYCRRVKRAGFKVYYLPASVIVHYHGASGKHLADTANQWRRLIPSSKIYHGILKHYILYLVMFLGQKWQKFSKNI
jgi:GT2 family glycosyltransferase